ncbi:MAG TPA: HAMP domain-containing sensor histidine kinase [Gammaproteobacteria bacterium]|nr:HAMP domain-containing sensor histidine kinase [Gammaproteobacteria bacterium]
MQHSIRLNDFGAFLEKNADRIRDEWEKEAARGGALPLSRQRFSTCIPSLLDGLAQTLRIVGGGEEPKPATRFTPASYLADAGDGNSFGDVVSDLTLFRECILTSWAAAEGRADGADVERAVNRAVDAAIVDAAQELTRHASTAKESARLHEESKNAIRLRERILAIVSHDLRNPLAAIDIASTLLLKSPPISEDVALRRQADVIHRNVVKATRLINDLLDMSSIQAGQLSMDFERCELGSLLRESIADQEAVATENGIAFRSELRLEDRYLRCDHGRIWQVLANLVDNSIKFCKKGDEIAIRAEAKDHHALISIADTGPGIPPEHVEHLFDVYWKGRRSGRGRGLGLFIAKGIVEAHGGRLWVESRPGEGSTFWFTLPLEEPSDGAPSR